MGRVIRRIGRPVARKMVQAERRVLQTMMTPVVIVIERKLRRTL